MIKQRKAVALISGGLDSMLAAKVIIEQGIQVEGINFFTGFCHSGHTSAIRNSDGTKTKRNDALWVAEQLGIKLHIIDIVEEYKNIVINPKHGYGKNLNPCLDCKIFMINQAVDWMKQHDFDFIITGEVKGQRPKSQGAQSMKIVSSCVGHEDILLRPLCAKLLPPTLPEREGWVMREKLMDFHGRDRKPQISLAEAFSFSEYAQPSGGCCVLTDENYTRRLADLWRCRDTKEYDLDDIILLKVGRQLRLNDKLKLIIGRDKGENNFLQGYRKQYTHLSVVDHMGPLTLIDGVANQDELELAARITARFSAGRNEQEVEVEIISQGATDHMKILPLPAEEIKPEWYV